MSHQNLAHAANLKTPLGDPVSDIADIERAVTAVDELLIDITQSDVQVLQDASTHILAAGGKRVRPRILLTTYSACGGLDFDQAVRPAAAIELIHTASIVHDDINDHGVMRRGRPSVNSIWGRTFALLTGDFLFTKVYELMAPFGELNVVLAEAAVALVEGETLQAAAVKENNFNEETYYRIIGLKTAALFRAGAIIGGRLAGASEKVVTALGHYGYNVGLAFQIVDDILDVIGDEETLGKTAGLDVEQGKGFTAIHEENGNPDPMETIKGKLMRGNRIGLARMQAQELVETAISALDVLPQSLYRQTLAELANSVVDRKF